MTITITGIAGSLRRSSLNRMLLAAAAFDLPPGARLAVWDRLGEVPPFSEDLEAGPAPAGVALLRQAIAGADGLLIATPRIQRVRARGAEERPGLGVATAWRRGAGR
jgi:chromate reductase